MLQKLWNKCKKCGCDKVWSDIKKIVGVGGAAFLVLIAGGKMTKKS